MPRAGKASKTPTRSSSKTRDAQEFAQFTMTSKFGGGAPATEKKDEVLIIKQ
jgi:hypothetical protein